MNRKQLSFDELAAKYGCKHIKGKFPKMFEVYQKKKKAKYSPVQRAHANFNHPLYIAGVFYITAKANKINRTIDPSELCRAMSISKNKFTQVLSPFPFPFSSFFLFAVLWDGFRFGFWVASPTSFRLREVLCCLLAVPKSFNAIFPRFAKMSKNYMLPSRKP